MEWLSQMLDLVVFEVADRVFTVGRLLAVAGVLVLGYLAAKLIARFCEARFAERIGTGVHHSLVRIVQYVIWVVALLVSLQVLGIELTTLTVIAGVLGVGISFGLQNLVGNFVAGVVLLFEAPVRVGDFITAGSVEGQVTELGFRSTRILTNDNITLIVPNSNLINDTVINWSHGDPNVRIRIPIGVAYGSDTGLVTESLLSACTDVPEVLAKPEPGVWFQEFGESSLNFELRVWTRHAQRHDILRSDLNYAIAAALERDGIEVPFPQRDLHLKSEAFGFRSADPPAADR